MNPIIDLLHQRSSCRSYDSKPIPDDVMTSLLEATCSSPSGGGFQNLSIIKVTDKEKLAALQKICRNQPFISKAPVSMVFCIDFRRYMKVKEIEPFPFKEHQNFMNFWMAIIDTAIMAHTFCIAAESHDLKTVYIGNIIHEFEQAAKLLGLPKFVLPSIMVVAGYPKSPITPKKKYPIDLLVHENTYQDPSPDTVYSAYQAHNDSWKMSAKDTFVNKIYETAKSYHGEAYAEKCKTYIEEKGVISPYQYWFGCYYLDAGFMQLDDYIRFMRSQGFDWV